MQNIYIKIDHANLCYSSMGFRNRSLKAAVLSLWKSQTELEDIQALVDVSVSIKPGERVALLGRNGAGKSTFLKMIAGLYPLQSGMRSVKGDISSLLELSLGFESEATGRENILYRGLMLGLSPRQVRLHMEEIIDFAELGKFIDYPIKTYSAGMMVRLAFAITTTLRGDILLLDEIIGAGDFAFMQKARSRILNLVENAKIVVFATHDWGAAKDLCTRGLLFDHGHILFDGSVENAVQAYRELLEREHA